MVGFSHLVGALDELHSGTGSETYPDGGASHQNVKAAVGWKFNDEEMVTGVAIKDWIVWKRSTDGKRGRGSRG
jgi:hypothetical protein